MKSTSVSSLKSNQSGEKALAAKYSENNKHLSDIFKYSWDSFKGEATEEELMNRFHFVDTCHPNGRVDREFQRKNHKMCDARRYEYEYGPNEVCYNCYIKE